MEAVKGILFFVSSVIMGCIIYFAPSISGSVAFFYVSILTSYLGLDIWAMIQKSVSLPVGQYKNMKTGRYVYSFVLYAILVGFAYFMQASTGFDYSEMYKIFLCAIFLMVTMLIGGLEGNKIATRTTNNTESGEFEA